MKAPARAVREGERAREFFGSTLKGLRGRYSYPTKRPRRASRQKAKEGLGLVAELPPRRVLKTRRQLLTIPCPPTPNPSVAFLLLPQKPMTRKYRRAAWTTPMKKPMTR